MAHLRGLTVLLSAMFLAGAQDGAKPGEQDPMVLELRFQTVTLKYSDQGAPLLLKPQISQEAAVELDTAVPEGLKVPKFKTEKQFYGILSLAGQKWQFVLDGDEKGKGGLTLDRNQNRDLSDDGQPYMCEWENSAFGGKVTVDLKLPGAAASQAYRLFLIITVQMPGYEKRKPVAVFYSSCYWSGTLTLGKSEIFCAMYDNPADGDYTNDFVYLDLNSNGTAEEPLEMFQTGEFKRVGGYLVAVNKIDGPGHALEVITASLGKGTDRLSLPDVQAEAGKLPVTGNAAPEFKVKDLKGREIALSGLRGKVVLIDFWATWCGPCVAEMPNMFKLNEKFKDKDFQIVGISFDNAEEDLKKYVDEQKIPWPQVFGGQEQQTALAMLYRVERIPRTFLVDRKGVIRAVDLLGEELSTKVAELLEKN